MCLCRPSRLRPKENMLKEQFSFQHKYSQIFLLRSYRNISILDFKLFNYLQFDVSFPRTEVRLRIVNLCHSCAIDYLKTPCNKFLYVKSFLVIVYPIVLNSLPTSVNQYKQQRFPSFITFLGHSAPDREFVHSFKHK